MRTVTVKRWTDYFKRSDGVTAENESMVFHFDYRHLFNPFSLNLAIAILLSLAAIATRMGLVLFLSHLVYLSISFLIVRTLANGLHIKRELNELKFAERQTVSVHYEIINSSAFSAPHFMIHDHFGPAQNPAVAFLPNGALQSQTRSRITKKLVCDGGMGRHRIGPMYAIVRDPLGIFECRVEYEERIEVDVYPYPQYMRQEILPGTPTANDYGARDVAARGTNVNFSGIRPYVHGDALKFVAWKLSAKTNALVVKEFEKSVNSEIVLALNLHPELHIGKKSSSSWELAKDACLSICSRQLSAGNRIGLASQGVSIGLGMGQDQFLHISRSLFALHPEEVHKDAPHPLDAATNMIRVGSVVFYIAPFQFADANNCLPLFKTLIALGCQIYVYWIDIEELWSINEESAREGGLHFIRPIQSMKESIDQYLASGINVEIVTKNSFFDHFKSGEMA